MDLYRLTDPEELYFLGIEDLINGNHVVLIEWPSKGLGVLPAANWILEFKLNKSERSLHITSK
jgi:tRNA threonylcarbamoyladenosine biosynthesis protein TsaE